MTGLTRRYHSHLALDDVSLEVEAGSITGLLGRNGAGKTTLLRILAGQEFPSAGRVRIHGAPPAENEAVLRRLVFVREDQVYPDFKVRHALRVASWFYPNWSPELATALLADFELPPGGRSRSLSRGMRSALGIVIGLAARAEVTLFDEPYAGLDAVARQIFYDRLLADYAEHPPHDPALHPPDRRGGRPARAGDRDRPRPGRAGQRRPTTCAASPPP